MGMEAGAVQQLAPPPSQYTQTHRHASLSISLGSSWGEGTSRQSTCRHLDHLELTVWLSDLTD